VIGQERAVRAVSFGVDIASPGYHLYALGPSGTGKTAIARQLLERRAAERPVPDDWCYVNNFAEPEQARALRLAAGMGRAFRGDMDRLVEELEAEVPRAFEGEEYARESQEIDQETQRKQQEAFNRLRESVEAEGFRVVQNPRGIFVAPVIDDEVITPDRFEGLADEQKKRIEERQAKVQETMRAGVRELQSLQREAKERFRDLDREVVRFAVHAHLDVLREKYGEFRAVVEFLDAVQADIVEHAKELKELRQGDGEQNVLALVAGQGRQQPSFDQYRVNLIVDNSQREGAPVILERNPTHHNLVGRVEQEARFGALVTNFRMIRPGALHRANGGYLLLEVRDLLPRPFAWMTLKRALQDREIKIESMAEEYYAISTRTLRP
jgi:predicted ATP-dependent protease